MGIIPARGQAEGWFRDAGAGMFGGMAAHAVLPLERSPTTAVGLLLAVAGHAVGWPLAAARRRSPTPWSRGCAASAARSRRGGSSLRSTSCRRPGRTSSTSPRRLARIAGDRLPRLSPPADPVSPRARGVQARLGPRWPDPLAGAGVPRSRPPCTWAARSTRSPRARPRSGAGSTPSGRSCSLPSRVSSTPRTTPEGRHTGWAYCHVPAGSSVDMTDRIEAQVERFAPGFRSLILARSARAGRLRAVEPELCGRRHHRRRDRPGPARRPACSAARPLFHARPRPLPLLCLRPRRGRTRHVRRRGRAIGTEASVREESDGMNRTGASGRHARSAAPCALADVRNNGSGPRRSRQRPEGAIRHEQRYERSCPDPGGRDDLQPLRRHGPSRPGGGAGRGVGRGRSRGRSSRL